ncbi:hypothetical protein niasHT_024032 [Heterodera trifolii]|uniref:T-complex protein 1 subunit gamma n=1 Tax=Heterodera trifolii TaxID=157864 RepID=A0ABD2KPM9_9BILA
MIQTGGAPLIIINRSAEREQGHRVQKQNIAAAKMVADVIRTSLGPRAMLKMLMDPMGGIVLTNDGNAILREITVKHPAAKTMIEIARTQDEETGDGTTSVIILAGEFLAQAEQFLEQSIHPTVIIHGYRMALEDIIEWTEEKFSKPVDLTSESELTTVVKSCLGTKMLAKYMDLAVNIALSAVRTIDVTNNDFREIDIKRYCRIEKIPGAAIEDSNVVKGVVLNKDVVHPKMSRRIEKPRVLLLDCPLEYKKGESQTSLEIMKEQDFSRVLEQEEETIKRQCDEIIQLKPNLVFTEKGISDLAQHYLVRAGITALRRLKKTDNNRLARVTGARIVHDTADLRESDIGTQADLYEINKVGDEYFAWITSEKTTAVTVVLRGPSKDIINEVERNIQDALHCVRNVLTNPRVVPGAGALEMALSHALLEKAKSIPGVRAGPYKAVAHALEIVPRTLIQNCGGSSTIRQLTALRAKHAQQPDTNWTWGINGRDAGGELVDMAQPESVWDSLTVRLQAIKTAIETAIMILRIDDIVSGTKKRDKDENGGGGGAMPGPGGPKMNNDQLHDWLADLHGRFCPGRYRQQLSSDGSETIAPPADGDASTAPAALCPSPESPSQWRPSLCHLSPSTNILLQYFSCNFEDTRLSSPLVAQLLALYYKFGAARCFVLQLVPTFIYLYLKALNKRWLNAAQMLETLFLAIYNEEILAAGPGTPSMVKRSEEVLLPLLRSASVVPSSAADFGTISGGSVAGKVNICPETASVSWRSVGGSQSKLLTAAAAAGASCSSGRGGTIRSKRASTVRLGPYPAIDSMIAENRFTVLTRLMRVVTHFILYMAPEVICPSLCRSLLYICRSGFSFQESDLRHRVLRERASVEVFADFSKKARIRVVSPFLVESINGVNFALLNGHADIALRALDAVHQRAQYEVMADVLLETNALRNALLDPKAMETIVARNSAGIGAKEEQPQRHDEKETRRRSVDGAGGGGDGTFSMANGDGGGGGKGTNANSKNRRHTRRLMEVPTIDFSDCS